MPSIQLRCEHVHTELQFHDEQIGAQITLITFGKQFRAQTLENGTLFNSMTVSLTTRFEIELAQWYSVQYETSASAERVYSNRCL